MEIAFWETARGTSPIQDFLYEQPEKKQAKIAKWLDYLEEKGTSLPGHILEKIDNNPNLWEFGLVASRTEYRGLFTVIDHVAWFVHMFIKKTRRLPLRELEVGRQRAAELHRYRR